MNAVVREAIATYVFNGCMELKLIIKDRGNQHLCEATCLLSISCEAA